MTRPVLMMWDGEHLTPANAYQQRIADEELVCGQRYLMVEMEDRSRASHNHQFAWLKQAWQSLPEHFSDAPWAQSPEALRKYALIRTRHCDVRTVACGSNAAALRVAAITRELDPFSLASVEGSTCSVFTAHSQSHRAMGKDAFNQSKRDILEFIAGLIGVTPETLQRQRNAA